MGVLSVNLLKVYSLHFIGFDLSYNSTICRKQTNANVLIHRNANCVQLDGINNYSMYTDLFCIYLSNLFSTFDDYIFAYFLDSSLN